MSFSLGDVPVELWIGLATALLVAIPSVVSFINTMRLVAKDKERDLTKKDFEVALETLKDVYPHVVAIWKAATAKGTPAIARADAVEAGVKKLRELRGHDGIGQTPVKVRERLGNFIDELAKAE